MAIIDYAAQDRPDLGVTASVVSARIASPTEGIDHCLKRAIRHLASHPRWVLMYPGGSLGETIKIWTDSDWVGDVNSRSPVLGFTSTATGAICHCSNNQAFSQRHRERPGYTLQ